MNGDVHQFLEDYFEMFADEYNMEDHYVMCLYQTWHLSDPPATWANLGIEPHVTIFILMEEVSVVKEEINQIIFEDLAFPFENISLPLYKSDYETSIQNVGDVILRCIELLKTKTLGKPFKILQFELEANGVQLDRYETFKKQMYGLEHCSFKLIYYPSFEVHLVLNGSLERLKTDVRSTHFVSRLHWVASEQFEIDYASVKLRYRGEDLDDHELLGDLFDLNCEYADHYEYYKIEVDVRQSGGGKTTSPPEPSKSSAVRKNKLLVSKGKASEKGKDVDGNPPQFHDLFQRCAVKFALMRDNDDTEYIAKLVQQMSLQDIAQFRRATENPDIYKNGKMKFQEQTIPFIASCFVKEIAEIDAFEQRCRLLREAMISSFQHQYAMCFLGNNGNYSHPLYDLIDARETVLKQRRDDEEEFKLKYNVGNTTNMET